MKEEKQRGCKRKMGLSKQLEESQLSAHKEYSSSPGIVVVVWCRRF